MTNEDAAREARKRWGSRAFWHRNAVDHYEVGFCDGFRDIVLGRGASWREALAQAPPDMLTNDQMIALPEGEPSQFARLHRLEVEP